jgi:hypothetical protein
VWHLHERGEHAERLVLGDLHKQDADDEGHPLAVAELLVVHRVRLEGAIGLRLYTSMLKQTVSHHNITRYTVYLSSLSYIAYALYIATRLRAVSLRLIVY